MGADIAGLDVARMDNVQERVESLGRRFFSIQADLGDRAVQEGVVEQVVAEFGHLVILVNAAGTSLPVHS